MKPFRVAAWYWLITTLVVSALFIAESPIIFVYLYSYWATFVAFDAAERVRKGGK